MYFLMLIVSRGFSDIFFYVYFSSNIIFLLVVFSFFFIVYVGGALCVFISLLYSSLVLFILSVLGLWEFLWRAGSYFHLYGAPLRGVLGRCYLSEL